jgi:hypothetical protein
VAPPEEPILAGRLPEAERSYSLEGSRQVLDEIRKAILQDIKTEGRRLSVGEALSRYGSYGVEAKEVIASMVEGGLLVRGRADNPPEPSQSSGFPSIMFGPGGKGFDAEALGRNIEAAVKGVVGEIERNVARHEAYRGGEYAERYDRHRERYERRAERHAIKDAVRRDMAGLPTDKWDAKLRENEAWNTGSEDRSSDVEAYRQQLTGRARRQRGGLIGNIISYLAVNAGLWYASLVATGTVQFAQLAGHVTLPSFVPAIVSAAWGIGVVSSIVAAVRGGAKAREAEAMPDLNRTELETYKKLNRVRDSMAMHTASTITVPILLAVINLSLPGGSGFLWFIFPAAAMLLGYLSHLGSYGPSKRKLQRELLSSLGIEGGWRNIFRTGRARKTAGRELGPYTAQYEEAERAKAGILAEIKTGGSPVDADLGPSLESYVGQVRLLAQSANEIDRIIGAIPMGDLSADKAELQRKAEAATSTSLKDEYRRSIEEIDKQEQSFGDLKNQSEVIKLRLSSSVNQLKQMRIDMARLKAAGDDGRGGIGELKRKTEELSSYLQDLRKGYDESNDPYAELEELARQAEERKRLEDKSQGGGPGGA